MLFNQFHDILAGCSIQDAYEEALSAFSAAWDTAYEITQEAPSPHLLERENHPGPFQNALRKECPCPLGKGGGGGACAGVQPPIPSLFTSPCS